MVRMQHHEAKCFQLRGSTLTSPIITHHRFSRYDRIAVEHLVSAKLMVGNSISSGYLYFLCKCDTFEDDGITIQALDSPIL